MLEWATHTNRSSDRQDVNSQVLAHGRLSQDTDTDTHTHTRARARSVDYLGHRLAKRQAEVLHPNASTWEAVAKEFG